MWRPEVRLKQTMAAAEVELKSPFVPLFQRGNLNFLGGILTPLWKRGEGEIFGLSDAGIK
jgi:hypothetical protein